MSAIQAAPSDDVKAIVRSLRFYQNFGVIAAIAMVGGLGGWAALTQISGAVIAPAAVVVEDSSKKVQHLEGGIVAAIAVRNADQVKAGQELIRLDDTEIKATLQITQAQLEELKARQARLVAERDQRDNMELSASVAGEPDSMRSIVWRGQAKLFDSRRGARADKERQLQERVGQLQEAIKGQEAQAVAKDQQLAYLRDELDGLSQLLDQQLVAKSRVLAQQRERSRIEGERGQIVAEIARLGVQISETRLQQTEARQTFLSEVLTELRDVETKISELAEREVATAAKLRRLAVLAPISGIVHKLSVFTVGGVVAPGESLMEIVPVEHVMLFEGQLEPNSIDQIRPGMPVLMRLTALDQQTTPELFGRLVSISADVRQDAPQLPRYYAVRAVIDEGQDAKLGGSRLVPGMPAEMMIKRGDRTVLAYMLKPFYSQLVRALRER